MSALGQKRTFAVQKGMSALPPKADMCGATRYVRFVPSPTFRLINVRFASRRTAAKFASLFDEAGGVVRDMTEIDRTGEHA